jgi:hypothetical protein
MTLLTADGKPAQGSQKPDLWANDVRRLSDTDACPCGSQKPFSECCRGPLKDGWTPENTLHMLFTAVLLPPDGCDGCGSPKGRIVVEHGNNHARVYEGQVFCKVCGLCRCETCLPLQKQWAVQSAKLTGEVPADEVVRNIRGRLAVPAVQRTVAKLAFKDVPKVVVIDSMTGLAQKQ